MTAPNYWCLQHAFVYLTPPSWPRSGALAVAGRLLAAPAPDVYILSPPRMYGLLRRDAGPALRPDPIYEDFGGGLFVRADVREPR